MAASASVARLERLQRPSSRLNMPPAAAGQPASKLNSQPSKQVLHWDPLWDLLFFFSLLPFFLSFLSQSLLAARAASLFFFLFSFFVISFSCTLFSCFFFFVLFCHTPHNCFAPATAGPRPRGSSPRSRRGSGRSCFLVAYYV